MGLVNFKDYKKEYKMYDEELVKDVNLYHTKENDTLYVTYYNKLFVESSSISKINNYNKELGIQYNVSLYEFKAGFKKSNIDSELYDEIVKYINSMNYLEQCFCKSEKFRNKLIGSFSENIGKLLKHKYLLKEKYGINVFDYILLNSLSRDDLIKINDIFTNYYHLEDKKIYKKILSTNHFKK